jgi:uncharacterized protein (DUF885 family)
MLIRAIAAALLLATPAGAETAEDKALAAAIAVQWAADKAADGLVEDGLALRAGDHLPCVTAGCMAQRLARAQATLAAITAIPDDRLGDAARLDKAVMAARLQAQITAIRWRDHEMPINSDSNFWAYLPAQAPFASVAALRDYLARLRDVPRYFDEQIANMRAGLKRGFTPPAITLQGRDATLAALIRPADDSPYIAVLAILPPGLTAAQQAAVRAEARAVIERTVNPAQQRLLDFLRHDYIPRARTSIAASALPDGRDWYRDQIAIHTTVAITPDAIHALGQAEVARIDADMQTTMRQTGFKGDFKAFLAFLRSDPQFYARSPNELLGAAALVIKKADGHLARLFTTLPRHRFTLRAVPAAIAPTYTSGRGGLDACYINTHDLPSRPLYTLTALTLHECVPGHSHQAAMALEAPARSPFRRATYFSGYGEGWGLYVEWLGRELGLYETPYDEFGRQSFENWRAARLVIDTGLHTRGWSRAQAIAYLEDHTALSRRDIEVEVDRYISWPGQALAYKLGEMRIRALRSEAETTLAARFDLRRFHDMLLGLGSVPLPVMDAEMRRWIAAQAKR